MMRGKMVRGCWLDERGLLWELDVAEEFEGRAGVVRWEPTPLALSVRGKRRRNHVWRRALKCSYIFGQFMVSLPVQESFFQKVPMLGIVWENR